MSAKNRGKVGTEDVIQVYIKDEESQYAVRNTSLCGFKRIFLNPGEEKEIHMTIPFEALKVVNDEGERILDSKKFILYIGVSGADERSIELTKKEPVIVPIRL